MLWWMLATVLVWAGEAEPVGVMGTRVDLPDGFKRNGSQTPNVNASFVGSAGVSLYLTERRGLWLHEEDARRWLDVATQPLRDNPAADPLDEVTYTPVEGMEYASQRWRSKFDNLTYVVDVHVVGSGPLGYSLLAVAPLTRASELDALAEDLPGRFHFMPTIIDREDVARTVEGEARQVTISQTYPADLFAVRAEDEMGAAQVALRSFDGGVEYYVLVEDGAADDPASMEGALNVLRFDTWTIESETASAVTGAGATGRQTVLLGTADDTTYSASVAILPIDDERHLDVRMLTTTTMSAREELWQELLNELSFEVQPPLDAFPSPVEGESESESLPANQRALLEAGEDLGRITRGLGLHFGDDRVVSLGRESSAVLWLDPKAQRKTYKARAKARRKDDDDSGIIADAEEGERVERWPGTPPYGARPIGLQGDAMLFADKDEQVQILEPSGITEAGFSAIDGFFQEDGSLILARGPAGASTDLGVPRGHTGTPLFLVHRGTDDQEAAPVRVGRAPHLHLQPGNDADHVLLVRRPLQGWGSMTLAHVSLTDGSAVELGAWSTLADVQPAVDGGWTVSGSPSAGEAGIYHLDAQGQSTLLVSGSHVAGREVEEGELILATRAGLPKPNWQHAQVYRLPAEAVQTHGLGFYPLTPDRLNRFAGQVLGERSSEQALADIKTIRQLAESVRQTWVTSELGPAPESDEAVDELVSWASALEELPGPTVVLLEVLVIDRLLDRGAEWIAGDRSSISTGSVRDGQHLDAIGYLPREIIRSAIQDSEGWWNPVASVIRNAEGRRIILGVDAASVRARVVALDPGPIPSGKSASADAVRAWLAARPKNRLARKRLIQDLVQEERWELVRELTAYDAVAKADPDQIGQHLGARLALSDDPAEIIEMARTAIAHHPRSPHLYAQLGLAYERSEEPLALDRAKACYAHVQQEFSYASVKDLAGERLRALEAAE